MNSNSFQKLERSFKPFKLCYNNEIHRISKLPTDYKTLIQSVVAVFKTNLPSSWALQYEDADGDRVMLTSDEDYKAMIECESESSAKSIKIYLFPLDKASKDLSTSDLNISKADSAYSQILPSQQNESGTKSESSEIISQPEEEAVLEEQNVEPVPEIKEVEPELQEEEVKESVTDESTRAEQSHMEPIVLAQNVSNMSAYIDAAFDYIDNKPQVHEIVEVKPVELQEEIRMNKPWRYGSRGCRRTPEARKERIRPAVTEILYENVPILAQLIGDYLKDPSAFNLAELTKKTNTQENVKPASSLKESVVHNRVICDGCGVNPIRDIRYKCSVCEDFDYCEKCEGSIEHPHSFLKIRDPKHKPKAIITILEEDLPQGEDQSNFSEIGKALSERISNLSRETIEQVNKLTEKLFGSAAEKQEEEKIIKRVEELNVSEPKVEEVFKKVVEPVREPEVQIQAPVVAEKKVEEPALNVAFVREICTIPAKITVKERSIYKTVVVKNTGRVDWPSTTKMITVGGAAGQEIKLLPLAPGKEYSCILVIECPKQADEYISEWTLIYTDEKDQIQYIGESFFVGFAVGEPEVAIPKVSFAEPIIRNEVSVPLSVPVERIPKKLYKLEIEKKARTIKSIFPEANLDDLLDFINKTPRLSIEDLIENYMA